MTPSECPRPPSTRMTPSVRRSCLTTRFLSRSLSSLDRRLHLSPSAERAAAHNGEENCCPRVCQQHNDGKRRNSNADSGRKVVSNESRRKGHHCYGGELQQDDSERRYNPDLDARISEPHVRNLMSVLPFKTELRNHHNAP